MWQVIWGTWSGWGLLISVHPSNGAVGRQSRGLFMRIAKYNLKKLFQKPLAGECLALPSLYEPMVLLLVINVAQTSSLTSLALAYQNKESLFVMSARAERTLGELPGWELCVSWLQPRNTAHRPQEEGLSLPFQGSPGTFPLGAVPREWGLHFLIRLLRSHSAWQMSALKWELSLWGCVHTIKWREHLDGGGTSRTKHLPSNLPRAGFLDFHCLWSLLPSPLFHKFRNEGTAELISSFIRWAKGV